MSPQTSRDIPVKFAIVSVLSVMALSGLLTAQATISAGPPPLHDVRTIYFAPSSDDFVQVLKARLETWGAVIVTGQVEEADAILTCQTQSRIVPAKVVVRVIDAQVQLVDRHTQRLIWSTKKSASWGDRLADDIIDQLKKDRERSIHNY